MIGAAFALVRFALRHSQLLSDRFLDSLERALGRQEAVNRELRSVLEGLRESVRESATILRRLDRPREDRP